MFSGVQHALKHVAAAALYGVAIWWFKVEPGYAAAPLYACMLQALQKVLMQALTLG
jgi:hypothetical protein